MSGRRVELAFHDMAEWMDDGHLVAPPGQPPRGLQPEQASTENGDRGTESRDFEDLGAVVEAAERRTSS